MMGGLAVAWQVKVTLSPPRTERGSMDRVTVGGSTQGNMHVQCTAKDKANASRNDRCVSPVPRSMRIDFPHK